jgi:antitoxin VapB
LSSSTKNDKAEKILEYSAMTIQINIKNEKARKLVDEIVQRTGESMTEAVTAALQKRLNDLTREERLERGRAIGKQCAELWLEPWRSMDHGDLLYDELGMPK